MTKKQRALIFLGCMVSVMLFFKATTAQEPVDQYPTFQIPWEREKVSLRNFSNDLKQDRELIGYIVFYKGDDASLKKTKKRISKSRDYLIKHLGIPAHRLKIIYMGELGNRATTVLHLRPKNSPPPYEEKQKPL